MKINLFQMYSGIRRMKRFDSVYTNNFLTNSSMWDWSPLVLENFLLILHDGPSKYANLVTLGLNGQKKYLQKFGVRNVWLLSSLKMELKMRAYHQGEIVRKGKEWDWQKIVYSLLRAVIKLWMPRHKFRPFLYLHTGLIAFPSQKKQRLFSVISVPFCEPVRTSFCLVLSV